MSNKSFYDNFFAEGHHQTWRDAPGKIVVLGYVLDLICNNQCLIDIGCGDGYFLNRIFVESASRNKVISVYGIDISSEAIALANSEYPLCKFKVMDAESLTFRTGEFDWVVSYGVFEHLQSPVLGIKELCRVLAVGGRFALMMPTVGFYRKDRIDEGWYEDMNKPPQMQWNYRRETWENLFFDAGLVLEPGEVSTAYGAINAGNFYFGHKSE